MKRTTKIIFVIFCLVLLLGFGAAVIYFDQQINQAGTQQSRVTLRGTVVCLPHKDDGPQTMECAYGLKADNGNYYALADSTFDETNERVEVTGLLLLDNDSQYKIVGTIEQAKVKKIK